MPPAARLQVLYEDNHLLVVVKPAGLPTQGVAADRPSLLSLSKRHIKQRYRKPGNVYLGVVSRLDTPVSGVVVLARTSKAARRLNEQFRAHTVTKEYWAIVEGTDIPPQGECVDWIWHDERNRRMKIVPRGAPDALEAQLGFRLLKAIGSASLLEVELRTGRKHQIRVQLAHRGWPIVGDRQYGGRRKFSDGIALHARRLVIVHPVKGDVLEFVAPVPESWAALGVRESLDLRQDDGRQ
jgi:23S rRNA pseudouridine1911/1915/1917 synthase